MDGMEWDVPDTEANRAAFGYSGAGLGRARAAYPEGPGGDRQRVRLARGGAGRDGAGRRAGRAAGSSPWPGSCYPRLEEDWLLIADRNFY